MIFIEDLLKRTRVHDFGRSLVIDLEALHGFSSEVENIAVSPLQFEIEPTQVWVGEVSK